MKCRSSTAYPWRMSGAAARVEIGLLRGCGLPVDLRAGGATLPTRTPISTLGKHAISVMSLGLRTVLRAQALLAHPADWRSKQPGGGPRVNATAEVNRAAGE